MCMGTHTHTRKTLEIREDKNFAECRGFCWSARAAPRRERRERRAGGRAGGGGEDGSNAGRSACLPVGMWGTVAGRGRRDLHGKCQTTPDAHTHRRAHAHKSPDRDKADGGAFGRRQSRPLQTNQQSSAPNPPANPPGSKMR